VGRTRTRSQQSQPQSSLEEEIAAAIALILAGQALPNGVSMEAAIGRLLSVLPGALGADVSGSVARLVVADKPGVLRGSQATRATSIANLSYRAHYAIEAVKRVASKVSGGQGVADALRTERTHLSQHIEASKTRMAGARLNDAAAERWGPVLSWNHTGTSHTHRPSHVRAHGANFDVRNPPSSTDGMLPGMALHCDCVSGPPIDGARTLV
jgi:hypothetical protein